MGEADVGAFSGHTNLFCHINLTGLCKFYPFQLNKTELCAVAESRKQNNGGDVFLNLGHFEWHVSTQNHTSPRELLCVCHQEIGTNIMRPTHLKSYDVF